MNTKLFLLAAAAIAMTGCSTIVNGSNQTLSFKTGSVEGANCDLTGGSEFAVQESFMTPASIEIPRSKKALQLECSKDGYLTASKTVYSKVEATTGGNLLFGGFVGAGVDAATGALYKYPETVNLPLEAIGDTPTVTGEPIS
ncbi:hypothetical protein GCM10009069_06300 [Algimonas arctica]|uniref:Lipoprotein n=1 Tax=Algimonas arctica TaxID=1479486 RepID=A0A8J3CP51_9PROT|nr:hypothetical protein [Algimonas arctica]GHA85826.1 hypothetical protein GCM10009069_06300 [Algimonas arctica]